MRGALPIHDASLRRQWQALALSLCSAVASLVKAGRSRVGGHTFYGAETFSLLVNVIATYWPGVGALVIATDAGRSAAVSAFETFKVGGVGAAVGQHLSTQLFFFCIKCSFIACCRTRTYFP